MRQLGNMVRCGAVALALGSPLASHAALASGRGQWLALLLAAGQAVAGGVVLWGVLGRWRLWAPLVSAVLLLGLALGAGRSADTGLLAAAGLGHAMLYAALLGLFASSLRPGQTALITRLARRLNPAFHAGMVPYTQGVTAAWCVFFTGQLAGSAVLLASAPGWWPGFVTTWHAPMAAAAMLGEFAVRRWRFRHERYTGLLDTIRGVRLSAAAGRARGAGASRTAASCPVHTENATRRPGPGGDTAPGPAG